MYKNLLLLVMIIAVLSPAFCFSAPITSTEITSIATSIIHKTPTTTVVSQFVDLLRKHQDTITSAEATLALLKIMKEAHAPVNKQIALTISTIENNAGFKANISVEINGAKSSLSNVSTVLDAGIAACTSALANRSNVSPSATATAASSAFLQLSQSLQSLATGLQQHISIDSALVTSLQPVITQEVATTSTEADLTKKMNDAAINFLKSIGR